MAILNQPITTNRRRRFLRISLRALFVAVTLCCIAAWWWQRPYEVESTVRLYAGLVDGQPTFVEGRYVETFRRQGLGDPIKHGSTRTYDADGELIFEEHWRNGVRHGAYRRWVSGELITELELDRGRLVRVGEMPVEDFMPRSSFAGPNGARIQSELQRDTSFEYLDQPLKDVIDDLSFRHDIPILLDSRAMRDADIAPDTPFTSSLDRMPLFAALCATLGPMELTCAYRYEVLWITTPDSGLFDADPTGVNALGGDDSGGATIWDQKTNLKYYKQTFQDVLDDIASRYEFELNIVNQAENLNDTPTSFTLRGVTLRSALGAFLYEHGLTCEAQGNTIIVRESSARPATPGS